MEPDFSLRENRCHTHIILSSIALIQMIQPAAREAITTETGFDSTCRYFLQFLILL